MATPTEPELLVLHALRLKSVAPPEVVAVVTGLGQTETLERLQSAAEHGWVRHRDGALAGWSLTPIGRAEAGRRLRDELDATGVGGVVDEAYRRFLTLNPALLQVCTDWQLVPAGNATPLRNDHLDVGYDEAVLKRLIDLDAEVQLICADLAGALDRFSGYGPRLHVALERTLAGDGQWLDRPVIDSYHTVWFELHEDLLATLGRERSQERSA